MCHIKIIGKKQSKTNKMKIGGQSNNNKVIKKKINKKTQLLLRTFNKELVKPIAVPTY